MSARNSSPGQEKSKARSNLANLVTVEPVVEKKAEQVLVPLSNNLNALKSDQESSMIVYRLYRRRWLGLVGMVVLNIVAAMNWIWFSPIAKSTADDFHISLPQVNWLSQVVNLIYLPMALAIPSMIQRFGIRKTCLTAGACLLIASWIRYAGVSRSLSTNGAYALLILGQIFAGFAQPVFQVLGPKFSETWFDLKARTTVTMIIAVANPIGSAIGQLIPPFLDSPRSSLLVLGVATTASVGLVLFIQEAPPTPPSEDATQVVNECSIDTVTAFAGSRPSPPFTDTMAALFGRQKMSEDDGSPTFSKTEKIDFAIIATVFGVLVGAISSFSILISQIGPVGYTEETAGFVGAALLLMGLLAGIITAPLFDRVLTHHLARSIQVFVPLMAACWVGLIFAVRPNNIIPIYVVSALIGVMGFLLLPVGLELGCEVLRNAEVSSAALWMAGNLWTLVFVLASDPLRGKEEPHSMRNTIILIACFVAASSLLVFKLTGRQARRELDVEKSREANNIIAL
ncbi:hypothetical protein FRC18_001009 [Serendipita sp. 400]|nr:hypothetical protein FRC18_001009 [Serendipita sp. 400]